MHNKKIDQKVNQEVVKTERHFILNNFCFAGGPQLSKMVETKEFCSSFGVKKFRKFLRFLYCFTSHKQHITIGQEFLSLF